MTKHNKYKSISNIEKYMDFVVESKLYTLEEAERCIDNLYYRMKKEIEGEAAYYRDITQRNSWQNPDKSVKTIGINGRLIYLEDFLKKSQTEF